MSIRSTFRKKEAKKKPAKKQASGRFSIGRLFSIAIILFGVYVGLGYLVSLPGVLVQTVSLSENHVLLASDITPIVEEELAGYRMWPYQKASIFFVPKKQIKNRLFEEFGRLDSVSIRKRGLQEIELVVEERAGLYMWCGDVESLTSHGDCYMLDAKGSLFDVAPEVSGDAYFKIFGGDIAGEELLGASVFSKDDFNAVIAIKDELERHRLDPVALLLYEDGLIEFVKKTEGVELYEGARLKFTLLADYRTSINNLLSALNSEPLETEFAEKEELLQYIDVRFDNRVYYKFR